MQVMTLKSFFRAFLLAGLLSSGVHESHAQAAPTATRAGIAQIGAGWGFSKPDFGGRNTQGLTFYGSFDFTRHWGIAGDIHRHSMVTPADIGEDSYQIGPRYVFHYNRLTPYIKAQAGLGRFKYQYDYTPHIGFTYGMFALGGGVDYRLSLHVNVRAVDFEYQRAGIWEQRTISLCFQLWCVVRFPVVLGRFLGTACSLFCAQLLLSNLEVQ